MLNRKMSPEEAIERIEIILKNSKFTQADKLALKSAISAFAYINQLEAEVERLRKILTVCTKAKNDYANQLQQVIENLETTKSEAIKEFAEKIKSKIYTAHFGSIKRGFNVTTINPSDIDNLVKEMVGE